MVCREAQQNKERNASQPWRQVTALAPLASLPWIASSPFEYEVYVARIRESFCQLRPVHSADSGCGRMKQDVRLGCSVHWRVRSEHDLVDELRCSRQQLGAQPLVWHERNAPPEDGHHKEVWSAFHAEANAQHGNGGVQSDAGGMLRTRTDANDCSYPTCEYPSQTAPAGGAARSQDTEIALHGSLWEDDCARPDGQWLSRHRACSCSC
jgi:hypothetical protein